MNVVVRLAAARTRSGAAAHGSAGQTAAHRARHSSDHRVPRGKRQARPSHARPTPAITQHHSGAPSRSRTEAGRRRTTWWPVGSVWHLNPRTHPQCVHTMLMLCAADVPLRCRPVGQTPIYDQLRGERINVDVPSSGADSQRVGHRAGNTACPPGAQAVFGSPDPEGARSEDHQCGAWTYPPGWPAGVPPVVHARHAPRHNAGGSPAPAVPMHPTSTGAR